MQPYALDFAEDVEINGSRQNIRIRSRSLALPALLFLHGGPGVTDRHLVLKSCEQLTKSCTLVCWDQRGCGKSFTPASIAHRWYDGLRAPKKQWIWFENSAHSPIHEEPERWCEEVRAALFGA